MARLNAWSITLEGGDSKQLRLGKPEVQKQDKEKSLKGNYGSFLFAGYQVYLVMYYYCYYYCCCYYYHYY